MPDFEDLYRLTDHDLLIRLNENIDQIKLNSLSYETRISKLENWRSYIAGAIAVLAFIISVLCAKL